jgi:hypothetical protein
MPSQNSSVAATLRRHSSSRRLSIQGAPVTLCRRRVARQILQLCTSLAPPVDENDFAGLGAQAEGADEVIDGIGRRLGGMGFAISQSGQAERCFSGILHG